MAFRTLVYMLALNSLFSTQEPPKGHSIESNIFRFNTLKNNATHFNVLTFQC